jgi:hypothetical protein
LEDGVGINLKKKDHISFVLITIAVAIQIGLVITTFILPLRDRIQGVRQLPRLERSITLSFGDDFAAYMGFLADVIPEEATVVLPPIAIDSTLGNVGLMQYFLYPRRITNCPGEMGFAGCAVMYSGERTYLLAIADFPPEGAAETDKPYIQFDDRRGVYEPSP